MVTPPYWLGLTLAVAAFVIGLVVTLRQNKEPHMRLKDSNPAAVRTVCRSLIQAMDDAGTDHVDRDFLEAVVQRCNVVIAKRQPGRS